MKPLPTYTKDGRLVGILKGNTLYKTVHKSKHLFKSIGINGAWGIDYHVLFDQLPEKGSVYIREAEDGSLYMIPVRVWREQGQVLHFKEGTKDHYVQCFLPLEHFNVVKGHGVHKTM